MLDISLHPQITGKTNKRLLGKGWQRVTIQNATEFVTAHYVQGYAIAPGLFRDGLKNNEHWQASQLLVIDIDEFPSGGTWTIDRYLQNEFVRQHVMAIVPSSSYTPATPKVHMYFVADRLIETLSGYNNAYTGLVTHLTDLPPIDSSTGRPAQAVFGTVFNSLDRQPALNDGLCYVNDNAAPVDANELAQIGLKLNRETPTKQGNKSKGKQQPYTGNTAPTTLIEAIFDKLGVSTANTANGFYTGLVCPFHTHTKNPGKFGVGIDTGVGHCLVEGTTHSPYELAEQLGIEVKHSRFFEPINASVTPDVTLDCKYLPGNLLTEQYTGDVVLKSPMGTGKTEVTKAVARSHSGGRFLAINHRVALSADLSERLEIEDYKTMLADDLATPCDVAICSNSLHKLLDDKVIPTGATVFIDEFEQVLAHFEGGTFTDSEAVRIYNILRELVIKANRVIVADAHMSDIGIKWLRSLRDNVTVIHNTYEREQPIPATMYTKAKSVQELAIQRANTATLPVLYAGYKEDVKTMGKMAKRQGLNVLAVHADNAGELQTEIANINETIAGLDMFLYSPTIGSGVDITTPVDSVFGVFGANVLSASEIWQMLGRSRNHNALHVYIANTLFGLHATNPQAIYKDRLEQAGETLAAIKIEDGREVPAFEPRHTRLMELVSQTQAARNHSMNWLQVDFMRLSNGYQWTHNNTQASEQHKAALKATKEAVKAETIAGIVAAEPLSDFEYDRLKNADMLTQDERYQVLQFAIEKGTGEPITEQTASRYHKPKDLSKLYHAATLQFWELDRLMKQDEHELEAPLHSRSHITRKTLAARELTNMLWGKAPGSEGACLDDRPIPLDEINESIAAWVGSGSIDNFFTGYGRIPTKPIGKLKAVLRWAGVKLERKDTHRDGERHITYRITPASLEHLRLAHQGYIKREQQRELDLPATADRL